MGQLLDLADEILADICTLICDSDRLALFQVIYVSKRLHRVASPLLVRHWPFYPEILRKQAPARLALLLVRNPHLQRNVKSIVFDELIPVEKDVPLLGADGLDELTVAARQRFPELANGPGWCDGLVNGYIDPVAALLLGLCTGLQELDLMIPSFQGTESGLMVLQFVSVAPKQNWSQRSLDNLRDVVLRWHNEEDPGDIQCAAPFFHLPNVRTLALSSFSDEIPLRDITHEASDIDLQMDSDFYEARFPVGTSPIEELLLDSTCLTNQGLLTVVSACKRLQKLVFTWRNPSRTTDDEHDNTRLTRQTLLLHAASLEELAFDLMTHRFRHDTTLENVPQARFECLKECFDQMIKLKRLTVDIHVLYYRDVSRNKKMLDFLPRSLEHLGLQCDLASYQPQVLQHVEMLCMVLRACGPGNRFGALKTLEIMLFVYDAIDKNIYEPVDELAREKGIKFTFNHKSHGGGSTWEVMGMMPKPYPPIVDPYTGFKWARWGQ